MKEFAKDFYTSKAWKQTRAAYISSVRGLCEICKRKGKIKPGVIVHHKIHLTPDNINDPDISLNWDNLQLLCRDCHADQHRTTIKRYTIDPLGRVIAKE